MRCDSCPLCPIAEDEICAIAETEEWGIEHKDGMMGCRHPYNWCKKEYERVSEYLRKMRQEMAYGMEMEHKGFVEGYAKGRADAIAEFMTSIKEHQYMLSDRINSLDYGMFTLGLEQIAEQLKEQKE